MVVASCSGQTAANTGTANGLDGTPAPGSKFSLIHLGMSKIEVQTIIGPPTDQNSHMTAKVAIPFYLGSDTTEINAHYKGEGVLTYASRAAGSTAYQLIGIKADPKERGFVE
jgi:hypothetical protein